MTTGTMVRKQVRLARGQMNEALHNHFGPTYWVYDGPSPTDPSEDVWRCREPGCLATMTHRPVRRSL